MGGSGQAWGEQGQAWGEQGQAEAGVWMGPAWGCLGWVGGPGAGAGGDGRLGVREAGLGQVGMG